jgi:hypothetical protein
MTPETFPSRLLSMPDTVATVAQRNKIFNRIKCSPMWILYVMDFGCLFLFAVNTSSASSIDSLFSNRSKSLVRKVFLVGFIRHRYFPNLFDSLANLDTGGDVPEGSGRKNPVCQATKKVLNFVITPSPVLLWPCQVPSIITIPNHHTPVNSKSPGSRYGL